MTASDDDEILKVDALGRVWTKPERREAILDAFEQSGLPGTVFADQHGINYQTFATWMQKRRRKRGDYKMKATPRLKSKKLEKRKPAESSSLMLTEVVVTEENSNSSVSTSHVPGLRVELPGGSVLVICDSGQMAMATELIRKCSSPNAPHSIDGIGPYVIIQSANGWYDYIDGCRSCST